MIGAGAWLTIWAKLLFKQRRATVKPDKSSSILVREGPFRFSRNPMYLGMLLALIGEATLLGSVTPFLAAVAFFFMVNTIYVAVEEKSLEDEFGKKFEDYTRRVRRWI